MAPSLVCCLAASGTGSNGGSVVGDVLEGVEPEVARVDVRVIGVLDVGDPPGSSEMLQAPATMTSSAVVRLTATRRFAIRFRPGATFT